MTKVSVIVPMYNVETTLEKCIKSIQNQTLNDIEIICVNDGSTDNTLTIIETIAKDDNRIKIISQENQGLGAARNTGIKVANGEYIGFVDSDDAVAPTMFEKLYTNAKQEDCDIAFSSTQSVHISGHFSADKYLLDKRIWYLANKKIYYNDLKKHFIYMATSVWNRIYRTKFIKDNNIQFQRILYEDYPFWTEVFLKANAFYFINEPLYYYSVGQKSSLINQMECKKNIFYVLKCVKESFKQHHKFNDIYKYYWNSYALHSMNLINLYINDYPEIYDFIRNSTLETWDDIQLNKIGFFDRWFFYCIKSNPTWNKFKEKYFLFSRETLISLSNYIYKSLFSIKFRNTIQKIFS